MGEAGALDAELARYLITHCDLPKGWSLRIIMDDDEHHERCMMIVGSFAARLSKGRGEGQGLEGPGGSVNAYPLVFGDSGSLKECLEFIENNSSNLEIDAAPVGEGIVVAGTTDKDMSRRVFDVYAAKFAYSMLADARALIDAGKHDEAARLLDRLAKSSRLTPRARVAAAGLYLDLQPSKAAEALALCEEAAREAGGPCGAWAACARGRAKAALGRDDEARAEISVGLKEAGLEGERALAKALGAHALLCVKAGDASGGAESIAKALEIEARFGGGAVSAAAASDKAISDAVGAARLKTLLAPFASKKAVEVFANPGGGVSLTKAEVLVLPPVFRKGVLRKDFWETDIEAGFAKPFGKRSIVFGDLKRKLEPLRLHEIAVPLCEHAAEMGRGAWLFDLDLHRGGTALLSQALDRCISQARAMGLCKKDPGLVFAIAGRADKGKSGDYDCSITAALFDASGRKLSALAAWSFTAREKDLDKTMKKAGDDVYRKMQAALK